MKRNISNFCKFSAVFAMFCMVTDTFGAPAQNARSATNVVSSARYSGNEVKRSGATTNVSSRVSAQDSSPRVATRKNAKIVSRSAVSPASHSAVSSRSALNPRQGAAVAPAARGNTNGARAATNVPNAMRSAVNSAARSGNWLARSAAKAVGASHASRARATAIYDDVTKMGTGYAACRDAYATCMDQLCGKANETYRRCFCSSRFTDFRDTEYALDEAKTLLMRFEDDSLNAIDKTAEEVAAMYAPTIGERAIKKDTSAAQKTLDEISDLLAGKKKRKSSSVTASTTSAGLIPLNLNSDVDDIWGSNDAFGSDSVFGIGSSNNDSDLSQLEGLELYTQANSQCLTIVAGSCENNAALNMARSSYNILISQDCNAYEKKIEAQRDAVKNTVRQAEKILRDSRLEDYRKHNSQDVNECLDKVRTAIQQDTACGKDYYRCLDNTGKYIDAQGNPIYKPWLFELEYLIDVGAGVDGTANAKFVEFLESRKMFAKQALDTCRDLEGTVWNEFKRVALIEIAQAQAAKVEEVRNNCVDTMKQCYDKQSGDLKNFDNTESQSTGALAAYVTKSMCVEKVVACASLYAPANAKEECTEKHLFDSAGHLKTKDDSGNNVNTRCGLTALLAFVDRVDDIRVNEGCATALDEYLTKLCTPESATTTKSSSSSSTTTARSSNYPLNCVRKKLGDKNPEDDAWTVSPNASFTASIAQNLQMFVLNNCANPNGNSDKNNAAAAYEDDNIVTAEVKREVERALTELASDMDVQLTKTCEESGGFWVSAQFPDGDIASSNMQKQLPFYTKMTGGSTEDANMASWGQCVENTTQLMCESFNEIGTDKEAVATYNPDTQECTFVESWYEMKCNSLGGYYDNATCYIKDE